MKTQQNILIAFILNLLFSAAELIGGLGMGSIAIVSDALHDFGDAASIGIAYFLEKKSKKAPDQAYTYGYGRYSVLGSALTTLILLIGSCIIIIHSVDRVFHPTEIQYDGMIVFACVGVVVNFAAAFVTRKGDSLNQRSVNLHMLEDVLGWIVVLIGAVIMHFTDLVIIDPLLSIAVAVYILIHAIGHLKEILILFLERTPNGICVSEIQQIVMQTEGVTDVHHIHIWSIDGHKNCATMHLQICGSAHSIKDAVRRTLSEHGISHSVLEIEESDEHCCNKNCNVLQTEFHPCHHHHH